jgi:hypothetical protein
MKNRLSDPSEICALEYKGEFRRLGICSVSATIGIDRSIFKVCGESGVIGSAEKRPSATTNGRFGERRTKPGSRYLAR